MEIEHRIDEPLRRVVMRVGEAPTGAEVTAYISALTAARPELAGWDWINDLRDSRGRVENADIAAVAEVFAAAPPGPCWNVYVSHDRNLGLWCRVMDAMFAERRHLTVLTPEAAHSLLDTLRAANPAPSSW